MKGKGWVESMDKFPLEFPRFIPGNGPRVMTF